MEVFRKSLTVALACCFVSAFFIFALEGEEFQTNADEARAYNVTRKEKYVDGHIFYVEEDRPIQKVAGVYRPMDLDAYISLKFGKLQEEIAKLRNETSSRMDDLQSQIGDLSQKIELLSKKQAQSAKPQEQSVPSNTTTVKEQ